MSKENPTERGTDQETERDRQLAQLLSLMFKAHPWHGVQPETERADTFNAFVEIVPLDTVKYETDKQSGILRIDRPQRFSSTCPTLYGFIPQTYCGDGVARLSRERTGLDLAGDKDPLDICVLSEKPFAHGNFLLRARPIGGLRMIDSGEADDKIVAVLEQDVAYGQLTDLKDVPSGLVERLRHYFLSYKQFPEDAPRKAAIPQMYSREEAMEVIRQSQTDYREKFGNAEARVKKLRHLLTGN